MLTMTSHLVVGGGPFVAHCFCATMLDGALYIKRHVVLSPTQWRSMLDLWLLRPSLVVP